MSHYHHLSIEEREKILVLLTEGKSKSSIAKELCRSKSTITRELNRNTGTKKRYSAVSAQSKYKNRRKKCRRKKLLDATVFRDKVRRLFLEQQWSPEQISNRLAYENNPLRISHNTIYRAIYAGMFDTPEQKRSVGNRSAIRKLRHRGKTRRRKGTVETRGKIVISNRIQERPIEADERKKIGHWEADTLLGKAGAPCLVTLTDRCSRYLIAQKIIKRSSQPLKDRMITMLCGIPRGQLRTITPDRGIEFAKHGEITTALNGVQFYFPDPHSPWQRGTNENTNGLLREYFPKSYDFAACSDHDIALLIEKLNKRPRKCLGWKSPFEVFFKKSLHFT
jgi:IS30 family transposase